ncbi:long-chain-fatty-acid--CoA ligase [Archaeoglobus neptunius]|uniref:long-chain-fatty-acid--CoA ligase n=1 Tax=Archaeoglobus neptunius TaxID=2798580 RepID=UPI0019291A3D|nr:long-chain fatty acid--CoA ligase [Archaeoglobus neptunius]
MSEKHGILDVEGENIRELDPQKINRIWTKFYDEGVRDSIEYPEIPAYRLLDKAAATDPNKVCFEFFGTRWTYRQVKDASDKVASFLFDIGVEKGERIVVALPNTPHYAIIVHGIYKVGGIVVQCNPIYTERELRFIVRNSEANKMFCFESMYPRVRPLIEDGLLEKVVICRIEDFLGLLTSVLFRAFMKKKVVGKVEIDRRREVLFWSDVMRYERTDRRVEINPRKDVAMLQYTGGTTGFPKGVMLTHYNLVVNAHQAAEWDPKCTPDDVAVGCLPVFHVYGMTMLNSSTILRMKIIPVPDPRDVEAIMKAVQKYRVTTFTGVPTMFIAMLNHPNLSKYNLTSLRVCVSGAAPLPVEVKKRWEEVTGGKLVEGYGLSEASPVTHCNPLYGMNKAGSIGVPYPDTYAVIVDEEGCILPPGEEGELAIYGPQVMKGYWKMEEETEKTLINGWLLTGDMAKMDEDGYFYIVDRKKDMIVAGGYNIYPREVEEVLFEHPAVAEAAVVGVPDPYRGETVKAFVVLKPEYRGKVTEKDLDRFCRERLAAYKVPRIYEFRGELPKSLVGKVLRRALREEEIAKMKK